MDIRRRLAADYVSVVAQVPFYNFIKAEKVTKGANTDAGRAHAPKKEASHAAIFTGFLIISGAIWQGQSHLSPSRVDGFPESVLLFAERRTSQYMT